MHSIRRLGLLSATALVIANMVGAGVFVTSGILLENLGSPWLVLLAWVVGGGIAVLGAINYGALARRLPESGGEYLFLSRTLHPSLGYVAGWISFLVGFSAPLAMVAHGFGEYVNDWVPGVGPKAAGTLLLFVFTALHSVDVKSGAWVQNTSVLLKLGLVFGFVGYGLFNLVEPGEPVVSNFTVSVFGLALVQIFFSYSGWNAAVYIGGEVRNPRRNLPLSLILGALVVTLLYLGLNAVFVFSAPVDKLVGQVDIARVAAGFIGGEGLANAVTALIAFAFITSVSSLVMAGPRVYSKMAEDGFMPSCMIARSGPPRIAILAQSTAALLLLWTTAFGQLLTYIGFTLGLSTACVVVGLVVMKLREGKEFKVPGWPWVPGLFLLIIIGITVSGIVQSPLISLVGIGTIVLAWFAWYLTVQLKRR
ncbi:MAG: amino acid permease [Verrucomicrobia bacterium]|nr:amino acid permease [Verrucomicrobiota bacterium]MCF7708062.1 amino acid permease [Verrucomicrobiota bacterium]